MTYKELQQALKQLRNQGKIPASFKLNQKKVILQAMWDEMNAESFVYMEKEHINGRIISGFTNGKYRRIYTAKTLKAGNSLGLPARATCWVAHNHGTAMYSFDLNGLYWSADRKTAYEEARKYGERIMIAA